MKTHTDYDIPHLEELQRVMSRAVTGAVTKRGRIANVAWGCISILTALLLALFRSWNIGCVLLVVLAVFFYIRAIFYFRFSAMSIRSSMDPKITGSEYILEKSYMLVINEKESIQFRYTDCVRLLETESCIYFVLKNNSSLIMDKKNLKGGSVSDLRRWMEERSGKKLEWMGEAPKAEET